MSLYSELFALCEKIGCEYSETALLSDYTSFKIGGKADVMVFPDTLEKIKTVVSFADEQKMPVFVIGKGSNLLVADEGVKGVVINTCRFDITISRNHISSCQVIEWHGEFWILTSYSY